MASELMNAIENAEQQTWDAERQLDSSFQEEMYLIEEALRETGVMPKATQDSDNTIYDNYFMQLINAISVE